LGKTLNCSWFYRSSVPGFPVFFDKEVAMSVQNPGVRILTLAIAALFLAACSATPSSPAPSPTALLPTSTPSPSPTATPLLPTPTIEPVQAARELIQEFATAWAGDDPDELLDFYSVDVKSYDATAYGLVFDHSTIDHVLHGDWLNGYFKVNIVSFFVSVSGSFAATIGTFASRNSSGGYEPLPYVSLVEVNQGRIVEVHDYYGGSMSAMLPLQSLPESASQPAASGQIVDETSTAVTAWEAAVNSLDIQAYLLSYADKVKITRVIKPDWQVLTKDLMTQDVTIRFNSPGFAPHLQDFFVSSDGRYVAVQGIYNDANVSDLSMVILLEVEDGKIVEEYDYIAF
jgi:ketosteroid isomerase-like protein